MTIARKTKSLSTIKNLFNTHHKAFSVVELTSQLKDEMNKTTIYRVLDKLEKTGFIHSFLGINGLKWYAKCQNCSSHNHSDTHPHFQCKECGALDCLELNMQIPKIPSRKIEFAHILLTGKCESCMG